MKARYFYSFLCFLLLQSGCATEFSNIDGISIKKAAYKGRGRSRTSEGDFKYWGGNIQHILQNRNRSIRVISSVDLSRGYDVVFSSERHDELRAFEMEALEQAFGVSAKKETREIPVSILVCSGSLPLKLTPSESQGKPHVGTLPIQMCRHFYHIKDLLRIFKPYEPTTHTFQYYAISDLAYWLEKRQKIIVLDETNLQGAFDFRLIEDKKKGITLIDSLRQLGLELKEGQRKIPAIYIDKLPSVESSVKLKRLSQGYQVYPAWEK